MHRCPSTIKVYGSSLLKNEIIHYYCTNINFVKKNDRNVHYVIFYVKMCFHWNFGTFPLLQGKIQIQYCVVYSWTEQYSFGFWISLLLIVIDSWIIGKRDLQWFAQNPYIFFWFSHTRYWTKNLWGSFTINPLMSCFSTSCRDSASCQLTVDWQQHVPPVSNGVHVTARLFCSWSQNCEKWNKQGVKSGKWRIKTIQRMNDTNTFFLSNSRFLKF